MYEEFLERNPTFESRVDAFTSGILTPDTKALVLWAMDDRPYTSRRLYAAAERFSGRDFPITQTPVWKYCTGNEHSEGSLYSIGTVVKERVVDTSSGPTIAYIKTDAGRDFGEPLAALACMLVNELAGKVHYASMRRLLGHASKPPTAIHRHGYAVYKIIKLLAENPDTDFRCADITEQTELGDKAISDALNSLGEAGFIHYYSPHREICGVWQSGWSSAVVSKFILDADFEVIFKGAREERGFNSRSYLQAAIDYCEQHVGKEVKHTDIAKACGMHITSASKCMSILRDAGYLKGELKGGEKQSSAKCNEHTSTIWNGLLKDVERLARDIESYKVLRRALDIYSDENLRLQHVHRWMSVYEQERTYRGIEHALFIKRRVLNVLASGETTTGTIHDALTKLGINVSRINIRRILISLERAKKIKRIKRGYYKLI